MPRNHGHDGQHYRVWPWILAIVIGLLTSAAGSTGYGFLGTLVILGAVFMIVRAVRGNRAARRAAEAQAARPRQAGGRQGPGAAGRRAARGAITLLP